MIDLKQIGEKNAVEILETKANFVDIFDDILQMLYTRRDGLSTKEFCDNKPFDYNQLYRLLTKLVHLEIIKPEADTKFILSQKGIDVYKGLSKVQFPNDKLKTTLKKHSLRVLKYLQNQNYSWNELNRGIGVGQSSLKNVLDMMTEYGLILKKEKKYSLTDDGIALLNLITNLSETSLTPCFEIQTKFMIKLDHRDIFLKRFSKKILSTEEVHQNDFYIQPAGFFQKPDNTRTYLRYREETPTKHSLKNPPAHILTWTRFKVKDISRQENVSIIQREREEMIVSYPSIIFFLEYLNARIDKKIIKDRIKIKMENFSINIDNIHEPPTNNSIFVEIKSNAWDETECLVVASSINEFIQKYASDLEVKSIDKTYIEFL